MPDFPELGSGTVHGRFLAGTLDSSPTINPLADTLAPDAEPLGGSVTFTATAPLILVTSADPEPVSFFPQPLTVELDSEGYLSRNGSRDIQLWATNDPQGNPIDWQWHVHFSLTYRGRGVYRQPFNFFLPEGTIVDLTVVAPLIELSNGTIIIQGPPGQDAGDIITAQGDLITGDAAGDAAILPVGAVGSYLAPEPAAPLGLEWKPLPIPEAGLKVYASMDELDAVETSEIGVLHVENVSTAFGPGMAIDFPRAFGGTGPGDFVVTTSVYDNYLNTPGYATLKTISQRLIVTESGTNRQHAVYRWMTFDPNSPGIGGQSNWNVETIPDASDGANRVPISELGASGTGWIWTTVLAAPEVGGSSLVQRNASGRASIADPSLPEEIANKGYVDTAIGAIPPAGGGLKVYADMAAVDAVRGPEIGTLHVADMKAIFFYGQNAPAELIVESSRSKSPTTVNDLIFQTIRVAQESGPFTGLVWFHRVLEVAVDDTLVVPAPGWWIQNLPPSASTSTPGSVPIVQDFGSGKVWGLAIPSSGPGPNSIMQRDAFGRSSVAAPALPTDITNKLYVDDAIATAPVPPHTHPELGGTRRFLFDATPGGDPGAGHISIENAGGQNRVLRVSKTDADGNQVSLAALAVNDSVALSHEVSPATIYARGYAASLATDAVSHWEFTAVRESGTGALPAEGTALILSIAMANGAGSSVDVWLRWTGTQAEYDAIVTKDPNTLYVVTG